MKRARKVSAVFLGLGGGLLALIGMSLGGPVRTVAAEETVAANESRSLQSQDRLPDGALSWCRSRQLHPERPRRRESRLSGAC